jgi:hypothetical protein
LQGQIPGRAGPGSFREVRCGCPLLEAKTADAEGRLRGISSRLTALERAGVAVVYCDEGLTPIEFGEPREPGKRRGPRPRP